MSNTWFTDSKNRLENETKLRSFSVGSIARGILENYNEIASDLSVTLDLRILNAVVGSAVGEYLDKIGMVVGKKRNAMSYAMGVVKITIDPLLGKTLADLKDIIGNATGTVPENIIIPAGTEVTNSNGSIVYHTTSDVILSDTDIYVEVLSLLPGLSGNIPSGVLSKFSALPQNLLSISSYLIVTNPNTIDSGADTESDDNYRFRIINAFTANAMANETAIRLAALSVPGVSDVIVQRYAYGIGTTGVYVISESPIVSQGLINAVTQATESVCSVGERVIVTAPTYKAVSVSVVLEFTNGTPVGVKDSVTTQVMDNIIAYVNNLQVGEELIIHRLEQVILDTSKQIYDFVIQRVGIGDYNFSTGLIDYYSPVLPVNQPIDNTAKWVTNSRLVECCY